MLGRNIEVATGVQAAAELVAGALEVPLSEDAEEAVPPTGVSAFACCATMKRSYSLPARRRNSRRMTRRITPIHEPANMPLEVMRHELEMKPSWVLVQTMKVR